MTGPLRAVVNYHATVVVRRIIYIYTIHVLDKLGGMKK